MTKLYQGPADKQVYIAPSGGVVAGQGYVIGANTFVIAEETAAVGLPFTGNLVGKHQLSTNGAEAIVAGARVFWDDSAKLMRAASATGRFMVGTCPDGKASSATVATFRLDGVSTVAI